MVRLISQVYQFWMSQTALPFDIVVNPDLPSDMLIMVSPPSNDQRRSMIGMDPQQRLAALARMRRLVVARGLK